MSNIYLIFAENKSMDEKKRHFGGKLFVKKAGKKWTAKERLDRDIERKHLKAYLRGDKQFHHPFFGYTTKGTLRIPNYVQVSEVWI